MSPSRNQNPPITHWSLKVVRGQNVGRTIEVANGEAILGSAPGKTSGINLADQEGNSPRKMEPRHATLNCTNGKLTIQDLESAGGTFVNRKRLLSKQLCPLSAGDVIQLGAVQLEVVASTPTNPDNKPESPPPLPVENRSSQKTSPAPIPAPSKPASKSATVTDRPQASLHPAARPTPPTTASVPPVPASPKSEIPQPPQSKHPSRLPTPFQIKGGGACRSWDDFLAQAAQRWTALRDELFSGRLSEYLRTIERPDLLPRPVSGSSLDDQLDDWLARLPTNHSSEPELDVHPASLEVRQASSGGTIHRSLRLTNVGYRLLRGTVRFETAGTPWIRLRPDQPGSVFSVVDEFELVIELDIPEVWTQPLAGEIVLETNGGNRRIPVKLEQAARIVEPAGITSHEYDVSASPWPTTGPFIDRIAPLSPLSRSIAGAIAGLVLQVMVRFGGTRIAGLDPTYERVHPQLPAIAVVFALVSILLATADSVRNRRWTQLAGITLTAAMISLMAAGVMYAALRSIEPLFGGGSPIWYARATLWIAVGAMLGFLSAQVVPYKPRVAEAAR